MKRVLIVALLSTKIYASQVVAAITPEKSLTTQCAPDDKLCWRYKAINEKFEAAHTYCKERKTQTIKIGVSVRIAQEGFKTCMQGPTERYQADKALIDGKSN
jgi:hypothetical protein